MPELNSTASMPPEPEPALEKPSEAAGAEHVLDSLPEQRGAAASPKPVVRELPFWEQLVACLLYTSPSPRDS